jgi:transcription elongation factor Elf1
MPAEPNTARELIVAVCPDCNTHSVIDPAWRSVRKMGKLAMECDNCGEETEHQVKVFVELIEV